MQSKTILLIWTLLFSLLSQTFAQKVGLSKAHLTSTYQFYKNTNPALHHLNYFEVMAGPMQLAPKSKMVQMEVNTNKNGYTHYKFQQFHEELPIFGNRYILHEKSGIVVTANGHYTPNAGAIPKPLINPNTARAFAKQAMKAKEYHASVSEPELCLLDPAFPNTSEILRLVYRVDLHSTAPFDKRRYFVDALSGKIVREFPLILQEGVPSTAKTKYYGVQQIVTDSIAPQEFVLRDPSRGQGIFVFNNGGAPFTNTSSTWDLTNVEMDEVALDAHFCTQEYYDMMLDDYGWQGQDGQGKALKAYVHGGDFANAYWDGDASFYGDGDCNYGPLTTLEVVGHEFTHGMIDYTSRLIYDSESGAINESLADMFGKMLERKTDPANSSWVLGHSFLLGPDIRPFRVMDDPTSLEMPAFYRGLYWDDQNGVHTNSSIGNLWFTMLVDGKQGINEAGQTYNVAALGMDKAGQLVFEVNRNYLTESSNYNAFYQYSVAVAEQLFGAGSTELLSVTEAWKAVGLPGTVPSDLFDLRVITFADENHCVGGQFLPVRFSIINSGALPYDPSMQGSVILSAWGFPDYTLNLTNPIAPGEVLEFLVDDWIQALQADFFVVYVDLDLPDESSDNNLGFVFYSIYAHTANDLELDVDLAQQDCFDTERHIMAYIFNNSCEALPAGTVVNMVAKDESGGIFWQTPYTFEQDLPGSGAIVAEFVVTLPNSDWSLNLVHAADPYPENNGGYISNQTLLPITGNYLNTFEASDPGYEYLEIDASSFGWAMQYANSLFFASTGYYQSPSNIQPCAEPFRVFDSEFAAGLNASIHACVDFSFASVPVLEFDLVQFRNAFTDTSNYQYSAMFQAKWKGDETGSQVIFGQPEGVIEHHNIALPPNFKGSLDLKFYTELGELNPTTSGLDEFDFILLDNLKLTAATSATFEPSKDFPVLISPNPAQETASIRAEGGIQSILLQNLNGQMLRNITVNSNNHELDLQGLANGFYLLNIQLSNGQRGVKKLVKME
jgi:Zn-dependent metalloprotease